MTFVNQWNMERKTLIREDLPREEAGWLISRDQDGMIRLEPCRWVLPMQIAILLFLLALCGILIFLTIFFWHFPHPRWAAVASVTPFFIGIIALFGRDLVQAPRWRLGKQFIEVDQGSLFRSSRTRRYTTGCLVISPDAHTLSVWPLAEREIVMVSGDIYTTARFSLFIARETGWRVQRW